MNCAAILKSLNNIEQIILDSYNDDKPVQMYEASEAIEAIRAIEKELANMKLKVTEYEIINGVWRVKHEYEIEQEMLNRAHQGLQKLMCAGMISGYSISQIPDRMTNGDRIRQMTDEQLAQFLNSIATHCREESCGDNCPLAECCACDWDWQERWLKEEATDVE